MDFLLWSTRSLHIFSVVVWFGGLMYQAVVTIPVVQANDEVSEISMHLVRRFQPFVWMCVWTMLVTGAVLMLFDPRFVFFQYRDRWSIILGFKQLTFLLMIFFSFGYARMFKRVQESQNDRRSYYQRMVQFGRINVALGIIAILLAAAL
jgi:uncharacterized membrane protein